jgi:carbonic anhydrase
MEAKFYIDYCEQQEWTVASGLRQSPIDIQTKEVQFLEEESEIILSFESYSSDFLNNGQNLQLLGKGQAILNHRKYSFIQMHFHADSEHTTGKLFL